MAKNGAITLALVLDISIKKIRTNFLTRIIHKFLPQRHQGTKKQLDRKNLNFKQSFLFLLFELNSYLLFFRTLSLRVLVAKEFFRLNGIVQSFKKMLTSFYGVYQ